ncbi:MAG: hypothetical protein JXO22_07875, partial [Phycisphaerae bacterium]|nr:hypothetical protein [Phycisphaerae bacterium]
MPECLAWAREYLAEFFTDEPCAFHRELLADVSLPDNRLLARVAPRGHAKSTCCALAYPLWCICEQHRRNIVIITHASSLATQFVCDIRNELESNETILAAYGDLSQPSRQQSHSRPPKNRKTLETLPRRRQWGRTKFTTNA